MSARWKILPTVATFFAMLVFAVSATALPAALLRAAASFEVSPESLANLMSVQFVGFFLATVVGGVASDVIGKKRVLLAASAFTTAGALVWSGAPVIAVAVVGSALLGMGGGILESLGCALLSDLFPRRRKLVLNLSQVMYCVGAVSGPGLMGALLPLGVSWRVFFAALAASAALMWVMYAVSRVPRSDHDLTAPRLDRRELAALVRRPSFLIPCAALFLYVLTEIGVATFVNYYLREKLAAPERWAILGISAFWLSMLAGRGVCALIPERVAYWIVIATLLGLGAAAIAAQTWAGSWRASFALFAVAGFVFAGAWPLLVAMTASIHPRRSGTVVGLTVAAGSVGAILAPPFMNFVFRALPEHLMFPAVAAPLFVAMVLMLLFPVLAAAPGRESPERESPSPK